MRHHSLLFQSSCILFNKGKTLKNVKRRCFPSNYLLYCQKTADGPKVLVTRKLIEPALQEIKKAFPNVHLDIWPEETTPIPRTVLQEKVCMTLKRINFFC